MKKKAYYSIPISSFLFIIVLTSTILILPKVVSTPNPRYVATIGIDSGDCISILTPCATINYAIEQASEGTSIYVGSGIYKSTGAEVILINKSLTLSGGWNSVFTAQEGESFIDGEGQRGGVTVQNGITTTIYNFTIQNGLRDSGGGIQNNGILTTQHVSLLNNIANNCCGGGIVNNGKLLVDNSVISNNPSIYSTGGLGLFNRGSAIVSNTLVSNNNGFGITNYEGGQLTIISSSFINNSTAGLENDVSAHATINNTSFIRNYYGVLNRGTMSINNSLIDSNNYGINAFSNSTLSINNSTITRNVAPLVGGGIDTGSFGGTVRLQNSILDKNNAIYGKNCYGTIISLGYNLIGDTQGCSFVPGPGDITHEKSDLGHLESTSNSVVLIRVPNLGSPVVNAGNPSGCTGSDGPLTTDQRGVLRVGRCDIGAVESHILVGPKVAGVFRPNEVITFTFTMLNVSKVDLGVVHVTDSLPISITYVTNSMFASNGVITESNGTISWNGPVLSNTLTTILFQSTITGTAINQSITNQISERDLGDALINYATTFDTMSHSYLPLLEKNYYNNSCPDFYDSFGNPSSGWPTYNDTYVKAAYLNGEYQILSKKGGYLYLFGSPACSRQNYTVEVDAHWSGNTGNSYGIIFGLTADFNQYYLLDMNSDYQQYRLYRRGPNGFTQLIAPTYTAAIHKGTTLNHIKIFRYEDKIYLEINGVLITPGLWPWTDDQIRGLTFTGLVASSYYNGLSADARFDNFQVKVIPDIAIPSQGYNYAEQPLQTLKLSAEQHIDQLKDDWTILPIGATQAHKESSR